MEATNSSDLHNLEFSDPEFIIRELKQGNQLAISAIFHRFYAQLCLFADSFVKDQLVAEDIVSDVFIKLWNKANDFSSLTAIKAFLYISTKNASLNYINQRVRTEKYKK
jgi:RNA polymerase sigma-70 factor (ECF subfamily)